jgi:hypothetical protein
MSAAGTAHTVLWATYVYDSNDVVWMQGDGNLVVYDVPTGHVLWSTHTGGHANGNHFLSLQNDGNLVLHPPSGGALRWTGTSVPPAADTPTMGGVNGGAVGGDCWQSTTPTTCTWNHLTQKGAVYIRLVPNTSFTNSGSLYVNAATSAAAEWTTNGGPAFVQYNSPHNNDVWTYLNSWAQGTALPFGTTYICDYNYRASCTPNVATGDNPIDIYYSNVWMNVRAAGMPLNQAQLTWVLAHEVGHSMGLAHNTADTYSVMHQSNSPLTLTPDSSDIGHYPGCVNGGAGLNCIYG